MDAQGYIDCGDNRDQIVFPWLRDFIAARTPEAILDFGCGDARFALDLAHRLAYPRLHHSARLASGGLPLT